jgi:deoxyribodipyrimidine photo-lyase
MADKSPINIHWFRRDLRIEDNAALYYALKSERSVLTVFIFDTSILDKLEDKADKRVLFIHRELHKIQNQLIQNGSSIDVRYGNPIDVWKQLIKDYKIEAVYANHDYEPYAKERDEEINNLLAQNGINFNTYKDQVIFEKSEVVKDDGLPYTIYTPYSKKWMAKLNDSFVEPYPTENYFHNFLKSTPSTIVALKEMGFEEDTNYVFPTYSIESNLLINYNETRDIPSINGTSRISLQLRFGTVSIRKLVRYSKDISFKWLNELCWREFYMMIIWHFPHVVKSSFKPQYDKIVWRNNESEFKRWCEGKTGYPIVDAGMRELNNTGFMHNRVRMIVASFLTKHLLIDWRWGEAYFASKLLDFELSSNNGGWQWAAGCGCDAAPYFRIFNPYEQTKKFDPHFKYIRKWVPEFEDFSYPSPLVDHKVARERCLETYKKYLTNIEQ